MTLKIETDKVYRTRAGDRVKIRSTTVDNEDCPVLGLYLSGYNKGKLGMWQTDGSTSIYAADEDDKLVSLETNTTQYQTKLSAGLDLCSIGPVNLRPLERAVVDTGVYLKDVMPEHMLVQVTKFNALGLFTDVPFAMVCSRSGLSAKEGVIVLNAPGIVDADYEDTIKVILLNTGDSLVRLTAGARIAQLVFSYAYRKKELVRTEERAGGIGSTGV